MGWKVAVTIMPELLAIDFEATLQDEKLFSCCNSIVSLSAPADRIADQRATCSGFGVAAEEFILCIRARGFLTNASPGNKLCLNELDMWSQCRKTLVDDVRPE